MARTSTTEVLAILDTTLTNLEPFIIIANQTVNRHLLGKAMDDAELKEIERWLSAHFAAVRDPRVRERKIGDASEKYAISGGYAGSLDGTPYGQQVLVLDYTGTLAKVLGKKAVVLDAIEENY